MMIKNIIGYYYPNANFHNTKFVLDEEFAEKISKFIKDEDKDKILLYGYKHKDYNLRLSVWYADEDGYIYEYIFSVLNGKVTLLEDKEAVLYFYSNSVLQTSFTQYTIIKHVIESNFGKNINELTDAEFILLKMLLEQNQ